MGWSMRETIREIIEKYDGLVSGAETEMDRFACAIECIEEIRGEVD